MKQALHLSFDGTRLTFAGERFAPKFSADADFWRLSLDYMTVGKNRDLGVYSHAQAVPEVTECNGCLTFTYRGLTAEDGSFHDITLVLTAGEDENGLYFAADLENRAEVRINELMYPLFEIERFAGDFAEDLFVTPFGLGQKQKNPYAMVTKKHTEYKTADYKNIWLPMEYPGKLSMPWIGIQSGPFYMMLTREDPEYRFTTFALGRQPRENKVPRLIMTVASYPGVRPGEHLYYDGFRAEVFAGDWREAADSYLAWAKKTWFRTPLARPQWVRELNGWQRIILKHQYGEIFHTYQDLPDIFREGKKYGITSILLFGWWVEGMDNGYPNYQPDPALGGADALRKAIAEIHAEDGTVVLYANGHLVDVDTEFGQTEGRLCSMKDIELHEYQEHYMFANNSMILRYGLKTFTDACSASPIWREKLREIAARQISLGSDGCFFDQVSCNFRLCFDPTHDHGHRIDGEPKYRLDGIDVIRSQVPAGGVFSTEWANDRVAAKTDYIHGCGPATSYTKEAYPIMYRYTFPEAPVSNRFIHDEREDWEQHLNYTFVYGLIFDISIYRGRASGFDAVPAYEKKVAELCALRNRYIRYFADGRPDLEPGDFPETVVAVRYTYQDKYITALWNRGDTAYTFKNVTVEPGSVAVAE